MNYINGLHFNNIRGDIYGGLTAAVVALPLAMSMGVASGVGPIAGMYGAIFVGLFAALFGGTPAQVSGPTGPMTVVMAAIFIQYTGMFPDDPTKGATLAFSVVVLGGLFQIAFGFLKFGKYIELVPHPVVSGFMSGIGVIIILLQFGPLLGHAANSSPLGAATQIGEHISGYELNSLILGIIALVVVYGVPMFIPKLNKLVPSPLLALVAGTVAYLVFLADSGTPIIGDIPTGFPDFNLPVIEPTLMLQMVASGLTLAGLGAIDSLLTSLVADNVTRSQHKSDRELIGQGIGNTIAGLFGGLPGAGATMRTVVNVKAGGRTPISGALHSIILLVIVLGAGSFASDIPKAVLAGILIKVGTDIIDWDYLKHLKHAPKAGVFIMFTVLIITVTVDLLLAFAVGMIIASFLFMQRMTNMQIECMRPITKPIHEVSLSDDENQILEQADNQILLFHLSGPMSFSSAKALSRCHAEVADYKVMLLDLTEVTAIDFTTTRTLADIISSTQENGIKVLLVGASDKVHHMLNQQNVIDYFNDEHIFPQRINALKCAQELLKQS
jgi:sulfate permease, SulP family